MAKRHISLVPLSREHYDGLSLALRLQQGTQALLHGWSHDPGWQAEHLLNFYEEHLRPHFAAEEEVLFPISVEHLPATRDIVDELLRQHRTIEETVRRLRERQQPELERELKEFGALLEDHIRKEDRVLFPMFEEQAPDEVLEETERRMRERYPSHFS